MLRPDIRLFCTDLDGTLLGDPAATARFSAAWASLDPRGRPLLVYNTARTVADTQARVAARDLPEPDFIIGSVGTELHDSLYNAAAEFHAQFNDGWDLVRVDAIVSAIPGVKRRAAEGLHRYKLSWTWSRARREQVEQLKLQLADAGLKTTVLYSCLHFLDIVPARADKGKALRWLTQRLGVGLHHVLVAGDSSNDSSMFLLPGVKGIAVANALPELFADLTDTRVFVAQEAMADGVLEGLRHFGVAPAAAVRSGARSQSSHAA